MTVFSTQDFSDWNGGTGFFRGQAVSDAIQLGENKAVEWLNTALTPTQDVDEFPWPTILSGGGGLRDGNKVMLAHVRLISVDLIEGLLSDGNCGWQIDSTGICVTIINSRMSIIRFNDPRRYFCNSGCPERIRVTYTYGFPVGSTAANTPLGVQLRAVVFNAALGFLPTSIGLNSDGDVFKPSYSAAGYSESRQLPERSGAEELVNEHIQNAKNLARSLAIKRQPRYQ